jgi:hypothetical protein
VVDQAPRAARTTAGEIGRDRSPVLQTVDEK